MNLFRKHHCGMSADSHDPRNNEAATSLPHLNAGAALNDHYDMADSEAYTNPRSANGMAQILSSAEENSEGSNANTASLNSHPDCDKLERSNRTMAVIFWILVVVCILVALIYVVVIIVVFVSMSRMGSDQSSRSSGSRDFSGLQHGASSSEAQKYCVHKSKIEEFKKIWDPEDQKDIDDLLTETGFVFTSDTGMFCFTSLQWVPQIMGKIHSKVQESVSYVEDQQEKINQTVNRYTSANNTASKCSIPETQTSEKKEPVDPSYAVYAHYFIDEDHDSSQQGAVRVALSPAGQMLSSTERIEVTPNYGQFTIWYPGFYFVYTRLLFKESNTTVHRVVRIRNRGSVNERRSTLLESGQGPVSSLQGVFRLLINDTLQLEASATSLDHSRQRASYYGAYLIRT